MIPAFASKMSILTLRLRTPSEALRTDAREDSSIGMNVVLVLGESSLTTDHMLANGRACG